MHHPACLKPEGTVLAVIDIQEKFLPVIHAADKVITRTKILIEGFKILGLPIVVTEQYPKGLGHTVNELAETLPEKTPVIEKNTFSSMACEEFRQTLHSLGAERLVIAGIESHVCVLQTALDALHFGYAPQVVFDAVSSRAPESKEIAFRKMEQAGVIPTTSEIALFELMHQAGTDTFKQISRLIK